MSDETNQPTPAAALPSAAFPVTAFPATSPCLKICLLDAGQECRGCRRTLAEIGGWSRMSLDQRRAVNARIGFRGHDESR